MIKSVTMNNFLEIDYFTQKSLEILKSLSGNYEGSLISCLDETKTASGARLLKQRIIEPFYNINEILVKVDAGNSLYKRRRGFKNIPAEFALQYLSYKSKIIITNLNPLKRPVSAVADNVEVRNARKIVISVQNKIKFNLLYDKNKSLQKKIKLEQIRKETY